MPGLVSPHFETLEGVQKTGGSVEIVDAGTNRKYKFASQITDYGEMTITRTYQGTLDDRTIEALAAECIERGLKIPVVAVKTHNQREVFRIIFEGFRITAVQMPTFDVNSEEKFTVSYTATCDGWTLLPLGDS